MEPQILFCRHCKTNPITPGLRFKQTRFKQTPYGTKATLCAECRHIILSEKAKVQRRNVNRYIKSDGYIAIRTSDGTFVLEHRLIMEQLLGRPLNRGESVHHKDGNRTNNDPSNLELWLYKHRNGIRASDLTCPHCGKDYLAKVISPQQKRAHKLTTQQWAQLSLLSPPINSNRSTP